MGDTIAFMRRVLKMLYFLCLNKKIVLRMRSSGR